LSYVTSRISNMFMLIERALVCGRKVSGIAIVSEEVFCLHREFT
jgi:hypothetical protein